MYSGIVAGIFPVVRLTRRPQFIAYWVRLNAALIKNLKIGASMSIDGVCQTVVEINKYEVGFHAIDETLAKTTLCDLTIGKQVCVERSLRLSDENGGHEVSGHIFGTGIVYEIENREDHFAFLIEVPKTWMKYIITKEFIAVDGVSLTVGNTNPGGFFELYLIPETLRRTHFRQKNIGDKVNIELDQKTRVI